MHLNQLKMKPKLSFLFFVVILFSLFISPKYCIAQETDEVIVEKDIPFGRKELVNHLEKNGIRTRPVFSGNITRHPLFDGQHYEVWGHLDGADYITDNSFWIGCHPELTVEKIERIMSVFDDFMRSI